MDLSIAIVSYNVREQLAECLSSVEQSGPPLRQEVFVVDNASHDGSAEMVGERFPHVTLIENSQNVGFARATNQALHRSRGRYLLLLNPDSIVVGDCLPRMVEFMDTHPDCGAATCRAWLDGKLEWSLSNFEVPNPQWEVLVYTRFIGPAIATRKLLERLWRRRWDVWLAREPREIECIQGNFFLVRQDTLAQVGGLDERFFMYYEDADWSRRIRQAGWKMYFHPGVGVIHHTNQSAKGANASLGGGIQESRPYYLVKHFGWLRAVSVRVLLSLDYHLSPLLGRLPGVPVYSSEPSLSGGSLDLLNGPMRIFWPTVPGATRYLFEASLNPLFLGAVARFVPSAEVELPLDELRKPGFPRGYWRAVPFCGDEPIGL